MRRHATTPQAKAIRKLDEALSKLVRARDAGKPCISCPEVHDVTDAGHFRRRECMSTRFDYRNVNAQGVKENRFEGGRTYEQSVEIDRRWGKGTAAMLTRKSAQLKRWEVTELEQLQSVAKHSFLAYKQLYDELS